MGLIVGLVTVAGCSGGNETPTRTRVAEALSTQTPWIIYVPVTVTPGPATATLEPTSTPSQPEATVPPTSAPATAVPQPAVDQPTSPPPPTETPAESPTPEPPTATPQPSCGESYQVTKLTFPENGAIRRAKSTSGAGATIQFKFDPVVGYELDPKIGYRITVATPRNSAALYISHNTYLKEQVVILNQQATYGLTQGDDSVANWSVEVIRADGEFNDTGDDQTPPLGSIAVCGPVSGTFSIELAVEE